MGYLNTQLKKVASAAEAKMEKQALNAAALSRIIAGSAAKGGTAWAHTLRRLAQRNQAIKNTKDLRFSQAIEAGKVAEKFQHQPWSLQQMTRYSNRVPTNSNMTMAAQVADKGATASALTARDVAQLGHLGGASKMPAIAHSSLGQRYFNVGNKLIKGTV